MTRAEALAEVTFWRREVVLAEKELARARSDDSIADAEDELSFARLMLLEAIEAAR